jgi:hypothetical protein
MPVSESPPLITREVLYPYERYAASVLIADFDEFRDEEQH